MKKFVRPFTLLITLTVLAAACGSGDDGDVKRSGVVRDDEAAFIGLTLDDAVARAEEEDRVWRISREDDNRYNLTRDYVVGRVTFEVDDGVVTAALIEADLGDLPDPADPTQAP